MPTDTWILTQSGTPVDLIKPIPEMIDIEDVAQALSNICRFGGHSRFHYSVAQHSVYVSRIVPESCALEALMHDAPEAYLGDIVRPLKYNAVMDGYLDAEQAMEQAIRSRFNLGPLDSPEIKRADMRMLATEKEALLPSSATPWQCLEGVGRTFIRIEQVSPGDARTAFIRRFNFLMEARQQDTKPEKVGGEQ